MLRTVTAHLDATLTGRATIVYSIAAAAGPTFDREHLRVLVDGRPVEPTEVVDAHRTRLHQLVAEGGRVSLDYEAVVTGQARLAAVYASGLSPMEFHAVAEAYVQGVWHVVDASRLAPRQSLLRVATGRAAADTAFLTNYGGNLQLDAVEVTATVDDFPTDDQRGLVQLR